VVFESAPPEGQSNLPPSAGLQFFGQVDIDCERGDMVVSLENADARALFSRRSCARDR